MGPQTYIDTLPGSRGSKGTTFPWAVSNSCSTGGNATRHGRPHRERVPGGAVASAGHEHDRPHPPRELVRPREARPRRPRGPLGHGVGGAGHLPLRPHRRSRRRVLDRHAAPDRERLAPRGPRVQLHPHRHHRPLPADAGQVGLLPDGLGRQRPAHRAPGAELLPGPVRPHAPLRPRLRHPHPGVGAVEGRAEGDAGPHQPPQLHRPLQHPHRRGREGLREPLPHPRPLGRLGAHLRHHRRPLPPGRPAGVPAQPPAGRGLPGRGARALGRRLPVGRGPGRARGPRARRGLPPPRLPRPRRRRRHRDHPPRAAAGVRRPRRPPRRRALPAAVRLHRAHPALRRRGRGAPAPPGRSGEGLRHRHDLHLRRPHRRHLVARAAAAHPGRSSPPTAASAPPTSRP